MATVKHAFFTWTAPGDYLEPGQSHDWWMTGFRYGDAMSVTAHSIRRSSVLSVENIRVEKGSGDGTLLFTVRNVGGVRTPGYGIGISYISD